MLFAKSCHSRSDDCPPLENGDLLAQKEFLRRYSSMGWLKKAQLIEGTVYMGTAVRVSHAHADGQIQGWLGTYAVEHDLTCLPNTTLLIDSDNAFQPDAILCSTPKPGNRVWQNKKGYLCGAPELVAEIAASSVSIDLRDKLRVYRRSGVSEYLVWRTEDQVIDWFVLDEGEYVNLQPDRHGRIRSRIFKGLVLDVPAALAGDKKKVLGALKR